MSSTEHIWMLWLGLPQPSDPTADRLSGDERQYVQGKRGEAKRDAEQEPERDSESDGRMNGDKPRKRQFAATYPPVTEWQIDQQDEERDCPGAVRCVHGCFPAATVGASLRHG